MDTFRKEYTALTEEQKAQVSVFKNMAQAMLDSWDENVPREERSERSRCMAIARTHLEIAVMFAVKAVTAKTG